MAEDPDKEKQNSSWLIDILIQIMRSPSWNESLNTFINEKCVLFDNFQEENKHEYSEVHNEFRSLVDNLLTAHLVQIDIDIPDFEQQIIESGLVDDPRLQQVVSQLMAAEDFVSFKQMMIDHHMNMNLQAEATFKELQSAEESKLTMDNAAATDPGVAVPAGSKENPNPEVPVTAASSTTAPTSVKAPSLAEERAFGASGGFYGRATMPSGAKKPSSNEKAAAIRKALCSAARPK